MIQIETDSIRLRPLHEHDADLIADACTADPLIKHWVMRLPNADASGAEQWIAERRRSEEPGNQITRGVTERADDRLVGAIWLGRFDHEARRAELAFWIAPQHRERGLATAAVNAMTAFGFDELHLVRVQLLAATENLASQRVAEKAGFQREGVLQAYRRINGQHTDLIMYSRLRPEETRRRED